MDGVRAFEQAGIIERQYSPMVSHRGEWRISRSWPSLQRRGSTAGDCGPSDELIRLAEGANLLLAEASYARVVHEDTIGALSSALDVGREAAAANVGQLVLTHLIPKTDESDAIDAAAESFAGSITVARPGIMIEVPERS